MRQFYVNANIPVTIDHLVHRIDGLCDEFPDATPIVITGFDPVIHAFRHTVHAVGSYMDGLNKSEQVRP